MRIALVIAGIAALGACDRSPVNSERDANESESPVAPGEWRSTVTIEGFAIPGMPADAVARLKSAIVKTQQREFTMCLTAEDAKEPTGQFFTGNPQCRYDHIVMDGGKIAAVIRCPSDEGMTQVMAMQGTYGRDHFAVRMMMRGEGVAPPVSAMRMRMRVESKRIGECAPSQG